MLRPILALAGVALLATAVPANAVLVYNFSPSFEGNDCTGQPGLGTFPDCYVNGSPLVAKYNWENDFLVFEESDDYFYPSIDGTEFALTGSSTTGTFTYNPGANDPAVRYWSVKAANQYQIWWLTYDSAGPIGSAIVIPTGVALDWGTFGNRDISHITFYDTDDQRVPEPASLALLGLGLLGIGLARRRCS